MRYTRGLFLDRLVVFHQASRCRSSRHKSAGEGGNEHDTCDACVPYTRTGGPSEPFSRSREKLVEKAVEVVGMPLPAFTLGPGEV